MDSNSSQIICPHVFISYSWSSPEHRDRVRGWAERLMGDGIRVTLDQFDLSEGQDKNSFMERMVLDPTIDNVLVICDKAYTEKANSRKGGVGTESQILSEEIYKKVDQSKIVPIVCEYREDGEAWKPTFMASRIHFDFSSIEKVNDEWDRVVRHIYKRPTYIKPAIGKPPRYILSGEKTPTNEIDAKYQNFRRNLLTGNSNISIYRSDFLESCYKFLDSFRLSQKDQQSDGSCVDRVVSNYAEMTAVRNVMIDWIKIECQSNNSPAFSREVTCFLEKILLLRSTYSEDGVPKDPVPNKAINIFVYDLFLHIVASLLKEETGEVLKDLFNCYYTDYNSIGNINERFVRFVLFNETENDLLKNRIKPERGGTYRSPTVELIRTNCNHGGIAFKELIQADFLAFLISVLHQKGNADAWYPETGYYCETRDFLPFFASCTLKRNFKKLSTITGIRSGDELRRIFREYSPSARGRSWPIFAKYAGLSPEYMFCLDKLDTLE